MKKHYMQFDTIPLPFFFLSFFFLLVRMNLCDQTGPLLPIWATWCCHLLGNEVFFFFFTLQRQPEAVI